MRWPKSKTPLEPVSGMEPAGGILTHLIINPKPGVWIVLMKMNQENSRMKQHMKLCTIFVHISSKSLLPIDTIRKIPYKCFVAYFWKIFKWVLKRFGYYCHRNHIYIRLPCIKFTGRYWKKLSFYSIFSKFLDRIIAEMDKIRMESALFSSYRNMAW